MPGLLDSRRWDLLGADPQAEKTLATALGVSRLVARVLAARGITDVGEARAFLTPSLERDWADPLVIPGMSEAADRVERAVRAGEDIAVFGDFDVDGMSSTCILALGLRELGGHARAYIPHRFGEGYGLTKAALDRVLADGKPDLIVTVDNGIAAKREVEWLREQGIDVVVTDHHEPADLVPQGVPVTDPKLAADGPSRDLAGAGVALKLLAALGQRLGRPDVWRSYTDVAALGTLSDMMQLSPENRALVADGIERLRRTSRPGLVALAACAGQDISKVTADSLPFSIIPRLNAAGRMGTTDVAIDLLMTNDPAQAPVLAGQLEDINRQRREIESALTDEALAKVAATWHGGRVIVVGGEGWHEGVKGIVASRIVNRYHVPTILFTIQDGIARGSGRSVGSVDLFRAVEQCSDLLVRFGGHGGCDLRGVAPRRVPRPPGVSARCPARRGVRVARRGHGGRAPLRTYGLLDCRTRGAAALWPGQQEAALRRARRHDEEPVARWCRWGPPALPCHGWHLIGSGHHVSRAGLLARLRHRQRGRPRLRGGRRDLAGPHEAKAHGQGHPLPRRRGREARRPKLR